MSDFVAVMVVLIAVLIVFYGSAILHVLARIEQRQRVQGATLSTILSSTSTTQSQIRTRMSSPGVEPILDHPRAEQHYEGRGVKRVARGGKADPASGESTTARIGTVKHSSYGGTPSNPPSS